jgi:hypothetical protein
VRLRALLLLASGAGIACHDSSTAPESSGGCTASTASRVSLGVSAYQILDATKDSGCISVAANTSNTNPAAYLLITQSAGATPGDSAAFSLQGGTPASGVSARIASVAPSGGAARSRWARLRQMGPVSMGFRHRLRERERTAVQHLVPSRRAELRQYRAAPQAAAPPVVGSTRDFHVCADYLCDRFTTVTGKLDAVGSHLALYMDIAAPANGLSMAQIDSLQQLFDTLYTVDTTAFGSVSDVDQNGLVLMLMTNVVNRTVTAAQCNANGYVAGFFMPSDVVPDTPIDSANSNHGEVFYTVVPDPNGTLSCSHTVDEIESVLPSTFLHELQHVIGFNQHVLVHNGPEEDIWLDEGLSSYAEELGGRYFLPDSVAFTNYVIGDLSNAYAYLSNPPAHFLLQESDTVLADFGAGWLYVRYLVDQFGPSIVGRLEQTGLAGTANVAAQTGLPFDSTATHWALANFVSDLSGFNAPPALKYSSWSFRSVFFALSSEDPFDFPSSFPLSPATEQGGFLTMSGVLHAGSGAYVIGLQAVGGPAFTLSVTGGGMNPISPAIAPRIEVIRLQ